MPIEVTCRICWPTREIADQDAPATVLLPRLEVSGCSGISVRNRDVSRRAESVHLWIGGVDAPLFSGLHQFQTQLRVEVRHQAVLRRGKILRFDARRASG